MRINDCVASRRAYLHTYGITSLPSKVPAVNANLCPGLDVSLRLEPVKTFGRHTTGWSPIFHLKGGPFCCFKKMPTSLARPNGPALANTNPLPSLSLSHLLTANLETVSSGAAPGPGQTRRDFSNGLEGQSSEVCRQGDLHLMQQKVPQRFQTMGAKCFYMFGQAPCVTATRGWHQPETVSVVDVRCSRSACVLP